MHSPSAEWSLAIGHLAVLDYLRSRGDADNDTASEVLRDWTMRHPAGPAVFSAVWFGFALWFWRHILRT